MLHGTIFLSTCLPTLKEEIHCKLQKSYYTLQYKPAATCNDFKAIHAIVAATRTEFYFVQSLQAQESGETS